MLDLLTQVWVTVFGLSAIGLLHTNRYRRWGSVAGLIGQPAWYAQLIIHEQWGMLPVFLGYTAVWVWGFWKAWLRKPEADRA